MAALPPIRGQRFEHGRLRTPQDHAQVLIEPPLQRVAEMLETNEHLQASCQCDIGGRSLAELARNARAETVQRAVDYTRGYRSLPPTEMLRSERIVLAGHQPELFHPGVWFKNFVLDAAAREHSALGINLLIDSDTLKSVSIRVPGGSLDHPTVSAVAFDRGAEEMPYEERPVLDPSIFASFGERTEAVIRPLVAEPLIGRWWPRAVERLEATNNLGLALAQSRHQLEETWGLATLELPQSQICELSAFHWFTAHLLAQLPRFWKIHNEALAEYRYAARLRSKTHPVPNLTADDDELEAPLWVWTADNPQRRPVFARCQGNQIVLTDRAGWLTRLELTAEGALDRAAEQLAMLVNQRVKLRTRALATTLFARLFLSDLFLHGIGGAKYDRLTDQIIRNFFRCQPPVFMAVSATVHLPLGAPREISQAGSRLDTQLRELTFHPERYLTVSPQAMPTEAQRIESLVETKRSWVATAKTPHNARIRHLEIGRVNAELQPLLAERRATLVEKRAWYEQRKHAQAILYSREYSFCLFPEAQLRNLLLEMRASTA